MASPLAAHVWVRGTWFTPVATYTAPVATRLLRAWSVWPRSPIRVTANSASTLPRRTFSRQSKARTTILTPGPRCEYRYYSTTPAPPAEATWKPPPEPSLRKRPVLILGAGVLGRRLALVWASNAHPVILHDTSETALKSATEYITDNLAAYCERRGTRPGHVATTTALGPACGGSDFTAKPWMVVDALPEDLALKTRVLAEAEQLLPADCILATNSSSFRSAEMAPALGSPQRLLNTHYYIPPRNVFVELMSCGLTAPAVFEFLSAQMQSVGLRPIVVPHGIQSTGFVFNRIWAAVKRETLAVLAEGVASPGVVDALFRDFFRAEKGPCERMDDVGLATVGKVEGHYLAERPELGSGPQLQWLEREFVAKGKLGKETGDGLFTATERGELKEMRMRERRKIVEESNGA